MNKQSQTCYVVNNGRTDLTLKGIRKFEYVNELTDRYIFTKEELEEQKKEWQREAFEQGAKYGYENSPKGDITPFIPTI